MRKKFIILFYLRFSVSFQYHTISFPSYFLSLHATSLLDLTEGVAAPHKLLRCRLLVEALKEVRSFALGSLIARLTHAKTTSRVLGDHWDSALNIFGLTYETSKSLLVFLYRSKKGITEQLERNLLMSTGSGLGICIADVVKVSIKTAFRSG
jgi:hypothetical protein